MAKYSRSVGRPKIIPMRDDTHGSWEIRSTMFCTPPQISRMAWTPAYRIEFQRSGHDLRLVGCLSVDDRQGEWPRAALPARRTAKRLCASSSIAARRLGRVSVPDTEVT